MKFIDLNKVHDENKFGFSMVLAHLVVILFIALISRSCSRYGNCMDVCDGTNVKNVTECMKVCD